MGVGQLKIRATDVTDLIDLDEGPEFAEQATRLNGVASFVLRDESLVDGSPSFTPKEKDVVECFDGGTKVFEGRIAHLTRELEGLAKIYRLRVVTYEDLADEAVVAVGTRTGTRTDRSDVIWLVAQNPAISTDYTYVDTIDATFDAEMDYQGRVRQGLDALASAVGAVYWFDDAKRIHWARPRPVGSVTAPWQVHTTPNGTTTFAPSRWVEPSDATGVINRMQVVGANETVWTFDHADSQTYFGGNVYEGLHVDAGITTEARAQRVANAYFRRFAMPLKTGTYFTRRPGIRAGQVQQITIEPYGIDAPDWIASVKGRFIGAGLIEYEVQAGEPELTLARAIAALGGGSGGTGGYGGGTGLGGGGGCGDCPGGCCTPYTGGGLGEPGPGQPINDELVYTGDGVTDSFITAYPYTAGSLRVWVDNINVTGSVTETDPAGGEFDLSFVPEIGEQVVASYNNEL